MLDVYLILFGLVVFWPALARVITFIYSKRLLIKKIKRKLFICIKKNKRKLVFFIKKNKILFASILAFGVYVLNFEMNFGIDLFNENLKDWVDAAVLFNNIFNTPIILLTLIVIFNTWKTTKSELQESQNQLAAQLKIQQQSFQLNLFRERVASFNEMCNQQISEVNIDAALGDMDRFFVENRTDLKKLFDEYCFKKAGMTIPLDDAVGKLTTIMHLSKYFNYKLSELKELNTIYTLRLLMNKQNKEYCNIRMLSEFDIETQLKRFILKAMIDFRTPLFLNITTKAKLITQDLNSERDEYFSDVLHDEFYSNINEEMFELINQMRTMQPQPM